MGKCRKKIVYWLLVLGCICLAGCGREDTAAGNGEAGSEDQGKSQTDSEEAVGGKEETAAGDSQNGGSTGNSSGGYVDIQSEVKEIFVKEGEERYGSLLGLQYYNGEAVQIWAVYNDIVPESKEGELELQRQIDVHLYKTDGSSILLAEGLPVEGHPGDWYLALDGSIYCILTDYENGYSTVVKRDKTGDIVYEKKQDLRIMDFSQLSDGKLFVVLSDNGGINSLDRVGELSPDTGIVTEMSQVRMGQGTQYIGARAENLLILDTSEELREVNLKDSSSSSLLVFSGTSYDKLDLVSLEYGEVQDLRILEDGSVELLRSNGIECTMEVLRLKEVEKTPVVIRGFHFNNGWIKGRVAAFNKASDRYHIVLEEPGEGGDWDDFAAQTSIQIATGKGPDILYGAVISDYVQGMIDKGGYVDLKPYMEASGILEEDYFPGAFMWRQGEKIYGVNVTLFTYRYSIDASVLGGAEPDIETLVNALYARQEKAAYMRFCGSGDVLTMFLEGSEDLWGMIDWEKGSCDFGGELFARMLEVAGRYPYDENQDYPILVDRISSNELFHLDAPLMQEREGTMTVGIMFDEGCYPAINDTYQILAINTNSVQKQGAWEFICFLLSEESQMALAEEVTPIQKTAFEAYIEEELARLERQEKVSIGHAYLYQGKYVKEMKEIFAEDVTEEWVEAFRQAAEEARPLPIRTVPVLEIIREEAEDYFNGAKSIDEVVNVIENRVQLYLDENYF